LIEPLGLALSSFRNNRHGPVSKRLTSTRGVCPIRTRTLADGMGAPDNSPNRFPHLVMAGLVPAIFLGLDPRIGKAPALHIGMAGSSPGVTC
jgi:hypothetical protein